MAVDGRPDRRHLGDQTPHDLRSYSHGLRALRHLGAGVLAGTDGALHLLVQARSHGGHRLHVIHDEPSGVGLPPDPALDRARAAVRGDLRPHGARQPPRHDGGGFHPDRTRQGAVREKCHLPPRSAREPRADRDDVRSRHRAARGRGGDHRERVQSRRPRLHGDRFRVPPGPARGTRRRAGRHLRRRDHESAGRHRVRVPRPAGALRVSGELLLDVRDLAVQFPTADGIVNAVSGLSFTLSRGETLGIVGESGSGKSVTNLAILGLLNSKRSLITGEILLHGRDLLKATPVELRDVRGKDVAMIFQDPFACLHPMYRVGDQIAEAVRAHLDVSKAKARDRAVEVLDAVGIPNARARSRDYPHQFSGGMRQRAMIAMALVHNPSVLIADEPTTALDVTVQAQILELIEEVKREFDIGVILVTHDLGVVAETANSVMVMYAGRVMEYGPANEIFAQPQHPYAWGLLDSMPSVERRLSALVPIEGSPPSLLAPPSGCPFHPRCRYRFEPCPTERPPLVAPVPAAHPDACWLKWDDKVREGAKRSVTRLGDAA